MYSPSKHSHVCTNHASRDIYTSNENIDTYVPTKQRHSRVPTNPYYETHTHASNTNKQTCQPYRSLTRTNQTHTRTYQPPFRLCLPILRPHLAQPRSLFFLNTLIILFLCALYARSVGVTCHSKLKDRRCCVFTELLLRSVQNDYTFD